MGNSAVSLWFDLQISTGMADEGAGELPNPGKGLEVHSIPVGSIIIENIYFGNFDKNWGIDTIMGFWEWTPKMTSTSETVHPLPTEWMKTVRGGWRWELSANKAVGRFVALTEDKPLGKKIGGLSGFKIDEFRGYNPRGSHGKGAWKFTANRGFWSINDGKLKLGGVWNFLNLIKR